MPAERVDFLFNFALRGERTVERNLEGLVKNMGNVQNSAGLAALAFEKFSRIFHVGIPAAVGGFALFEGFNKLNDAGEKIVKLQEEVGKLSRVKIGDLGTKELVNHLDKVKAKIEELSETNGSMLKNIGEASLDIVLNVSAMGASALNGIGIPGLKGARGKFRSFTSKEIAKSQLERLKQGSDRELFGRERFENVPEDRHRGQKLGEMKAGGDAFRLNDIDRNYYSDLVERRKIELSKFNQSGHQGMGKADVESKREELQKALDEAMEKMVETWNKRVEMNRDAVTKEQELLRRKEDLEEAMNERLRQQERTQATGLKVRHLQSLGGLGARAIHFGQANHQTLSEKHAIRELQDVNRNLEKVRHLPAYAG